MQDPDGLDREAIEELDAHLDELFPRDEALDSTVKFQCDVCREVFDFPEELQDHQDPFCANDLPF